MRNLILNKHSCWGRVMSVEPPGGDRICVDPITNTTYLLTHTGGCIFPQGEVGDGTSLDWVKWAAFGVNTKGLAGADLLVTDASALILTTREGEVVRVALQSDPNTSPPFADVSSVGAVEDGLLCGAWSPDEELLALVTAWGKVILLTAEFDPLEEFELEQDDFGENKFVSVGWGRKETQFHGSEGKAAARSVAEGSSSLSPASDLDDCQPRISWRGDGQMFVVSYMSGCGEVRHRQVRVVSREGVVQATGEPMSGLGQCVAWQPSGSLIAATQTRPNKHQVIFFEKNGLKHGEFSLPFKPGEMHVKELLWSQDSSVLLTWLCPVPPEGGTKTGPDLLQLWISSNYHWYLKQELKFAEGVNYVCWGTERALELHVLTPTHLHHYRWVTEYSVSRGVGPLDLALGAVVDGCQLLLTPFRQVVVPPPMSAYQVSFPGQVKAVLFAPPLVEGPAEVSLESSLTVEDSGFLEGVEPPGSNSNNICVVHGPGPHTLTFLTQTHPDQLLQDHSHTVKITAVGGNGFQVKVKVHRVAAQHQVEWGEGEECDQLYNWVWASKNTLLACHSLAGNCHLVVLNLLGVGTEGGRVVVGARLPVEDLVVSIAPSPDGLIAGLQLASGELLMLDLQTQTIEPFLVEGKEVRFPSLCEKVKLCALHGLPPSLLPLGLTSRNHLYLGPHLLLPNCTSFHLHTDHLLATTTDHTLKVLPLTHLTHVWVGGDRVELVWGERRVERGATIVTSVGEDTHVVLQMPRGNLEVVSPRVLAVHTLQALLSTHQYSQAMDLMRRQRVDLNLLYDHDPKVFLTHIHLFIQTVNDPHRIDLFLASLNETDVTSTMYAFNYAKHERHLNKGTKQVSSGNSKVETVCMAVREAMMKSDEEKYLLPILTSYVKVTPSQMDVALRHVKDMKDAKDRSFKVSAEEGLKHLLYIADANELFDVALGTYDFDLVMMVAERSQKDPKEYLPFLNQLQQMDEQYQRFKINVHLRRFTKALECMKDNTSRQEECLALIKSENLYREALEIFPQGSAINQAICESYGVYLASKNYYSEAAIMFSRSGQLKCAREAYQEAGNWKMVLVVGAQEGLDHEKMGEVCQGLVTLLVDRGRYQEAAWIYEEYLKNEEDALECLVLAGVWEDALRVAYKYARLDLIETHIKPGVLEHQKSCLAQIEDLTSTLVWQCSRLNEVRKMKQQQHQDLLDGVEGAGEVLDTDLYSESSTITGASHAQSHSSSSASGRTYRSTKNKRKLERKKYSTKEGALYEDLGLVTELHKLYTRADSLASVLTPLCSTLVSFGLDSQAAALQAKYTDLLALLDQRKKDIWHTTGPSEEEEQEFGPQMTAEAAVSQARARMELSWLERRMLVLEPHLRYPPQSMCTSSWSLHMLCKKR